MRRILKWILIALIVILVIAAILAFLNRDKLERLYNVNTLFSEENIVGNFSNMKGMFFWAPIENTGTPTDWPEDIRPIAQNYTYKGETKSVTAWLEETRNTSLLVVHDGAVVHEQYDLGTRRADPRISWSMAKSFLSAVFGIAVAEGKIKSLDDPVTDYVESLEGTTYDGVTIRNVLNMASGVKFNEDYLDFNSDINRMGRVLALGASMDEFAASLEGREREQGSARKYTSIDTHVLAMVLRQATGRSLIELIGEQIVSPLGFEGEAYYLTDGYGVAFALGGLNITTRDYARFGQMFLNNGYWYGKSIVPQSWARESVAASAPAPFDPDSPFDYGYQWWVPPNANGEFFAVGIYGQYIYVNRPMKTVIVKTSAHRGFRDDGVRGNNIKLETIEMFRAIAAGLQAQ